MTAEIVALILGASVVLCVTIWKVAILKYREPTIKTVSARLEALESKTVTISQEDWVALKQEVATIRVANGLRTRK